jgi:hypothetical protein
VTDEEAAATLMDLRGILPIDESRASGPSQTASDPREQFFFPDIVSATSNSFIVLGPRAGVRIGSWGRRCFLVCFFR